MSIRVRRQLLALAALAAASAASAATTFRVVRDDEGASLRVSADSCRMVSLAPGTTAMLYAAGAGHCLVGTTAHSTEPAEAAKLTVVGDAETLDLEQLVALRPAVVVVAVDVVQRVRIDRIRALGFPVYQVHIARLADIPASLRRLGAMAGTEVAAKRAADQLDADLAALRAKFRDRRPLRALYQIWDQPIYTIGGRHVINDALNLCGARNIFADLATAAPAVTRESVLARDPEIILASSPPGASQDWLDTWRHFPTLAAVRNDLLVAYTDERIDRMGPSLILATAHLCAVIEEARNRIAPVVR